MVRGKQLCSSKRLMTPSRSTSTAKTPKKKSSTRTSTRTTSKKSGSTARSFIKESGQTGNYIDLRNVIEDIYKEEKEKEEIVVSNSRKAELFPHQPMFPYRLDDKKESKTCWFQCYEHVEKAHQSLSHDFKGV